MSPWRHLLTVDARVRIDGLEVTLLAEVLEGTPDLVEARFVAVVDDARVAHLRLTAVLKGATGVPGGLPCGTALDVFTVKDFRGVGLARPLWPLASLTAMTERWESGPLHSASRTCEGQGYAEAVGGPIPPLAEGRYVECPERFDPSNALWRDRAHLDLEARRG